MISKCKTCKNCLFYQGFDEYAGPIKSWMNKEWGTCTLSKSHLDGDGKQVPDDKTTFFYAVGGTSASLMVHESHCCSSNKI